MNRRNKRFAAGLLLTVLVNVVSLAYPPGGAPQAEADASSGTVNAEILASPDPPSYLVYLPLISRPGLPSPGDAIIVSWAQVKESGSRDVLLHWRVPPDGSTAPASSLLSLATDSYAIDRRTAGAAWQTLGQAGFVSNVTEMEAILGADLVEQLGYDLSSDPSGTPLTAQEIYDLLKGDPALAQVLSQTHYRVGLATGTSYLDRSAPQNVTLEYRVRDLSSGDGEFEPASVPPKNPDIHPPFNLRETWEGPDGLGQAPSSRLDNARERYSWQTTSDYMPWDGQVYLIWDSPEQGEGNGGEIMDGRQAMNTAGYRVYRSPHGLRQWSSVNPRKAHCATEALCELLVGVAPEPTESNFPPHYFVDNLHESSPNPSDVYNIWDYKVCAVDMLRNDTECSPVLTVDVRELQPPAAVQDISTFVPQDQSEVTITWTYSDTLETSPPLRFYVTRSPTLTVPLSEWTVVKESGSLVDYVSIRNTGPVTLSVTDRPPRDQVFWYRVQVRDDAGNWSSEGVAEKAARYTRTAPTLPEITYDKSACENNPLPLTLSGLDDNVFLINLYRSFDVTGPFELVERFEVTQGTSNWVEISDDFLPPYPAYAYYRLEAVDDHGNVSASEEYCAQLGEGPLMDPGLPIITTEVTCDPEQPCEVTTSVGDSSAGKMPVGVEFSLPGEDGVPVTTTKTFTDSYTMPVNNGAWINLSASYSYGDSTISDTVTTWERVLTNEFLDTERNLNGLGPVALATWVTDTAVAPPEHYVRIRILYDDSWTPPVAVFRRAAGGSWLQVGNVATRQPHTYEDRSDPSPDQRYEYVILVLSPTSHELLGYWGPVTVEPLVTDPPVARITSQITYPRGIDPRCSLSRSSSGPSTIYLQNGWELHDVTYFIARDGDPDCPTHMRVARPDLAHAYGTGTLTNGTERWTGVGFMDISIDGSSNHTDGRIVTNLSHTATPGGAFRIHVDDVEFTSTDVKAEIEVALPSRIKVEVPEADRTDAIFGVFSGLTTNFRFDPLSLGAGVTFIDENLPWRLHSDVSRIDESRLDLGAPVTTSFRFVGGEGTGRPDRNLSFMRPSYQSANAIITPHGLTGRFFAEETIEYATSFPAHFIVSGNGATVSISDSQITGGELRDASVSLTYDARRTVTDYAVYNRTCNGQSASHYSLCQGFLDTYVTEERTLILTPAPAGSAINIGPNGYLSATVTMDQETTWPSFSTDPAKGNLFIAPAAFPDAPTSWAPMPAEAAWQRLPDPTTGGTFDPGLNLNSEDASIHYTFFDPSEFRGSAMNLYIRKGGVSGHVIMTDTGPRTNQWGYSENVQRIELQFLDNTILAPPEAFITDLTLPYPTDATLPLTVTVTDGSNRPLSGIFREEPMEVTHRYWSFTETPTAWAYDWAEPGDYSVNITGVLTRILQLQGSTAAVPGLQPADASPTTHAVELTFNSEWLPDGDIGTLRLQEPDALDYRTGSFRFILSAVRLSRYYSTILDHTSNPSTLGIDVNDTMDTLSEELLDSAYNLTGDSLAACAATIVDGCGFIVLDGDVGVDYFGEVKSDAVTSQAINADIPAVDDVVGEFPLAANIAISVTKWVGIQSGYVPWVWPVLNQVLDVDLPVKFLGNTEGGILVALIRDVGVFPGEEIFRADVAGIVDVRWDLSTGYNDQVGLFLGYGASQAAFRALAMNRPRWSGDIRPYDQWSSVSSDVKTWAEKFGYTQLTGTEDDPVDLAEEIWPDWCGAWSGSTCTDRLEYGEVFTVTEPVLKDLGDQEAYGVTGVQEGESLATSNVAMNAGSLTAVLRREGLGLELTQLEGGGRIQWDIWDYSYEYEDIELVDIDFFLRANWLRFEMDRDGEIEAFGDTYANLLYDWGIDASVHALATPVNDEWRFEGVVDAEPIGIAGLSALELDGTFGSGPYVVPNTGGVEYVSYFGGNFEAYFLDYRVGGGFLYGVVPQESAILREAGFGEIMDTVGNQGSYAGIYVYVFGDFPLAGDSCMLKANAGGEIRFWYFWSDDVWGGTLTGFVHATAACVLSARGQLELGYARLDNGGHMYGRTCANSQCDIFGGSFWIATGVGWCSPSSWHRWADRWWGDSWCYCIGAYVDLSYMDPGGLDYSWKLDYE